MRSFKLLVLAVMPFMAGCFPIELDVSKDGRILVARQEGFFALDPAQGKVTKLYAPESGKPCFARFAPNGKSILAVVEDSGTFNFTLAPIGGGEAKSIFSGSNTTYARFAPNGGTVAITRVADSAVEPLKDSLPELHMVVLPAALEKVIARNVSSSIRWFPDSKRILLFQIQKKDDKSNYFGQLASLDTASGKLTPLASVGGSNDVYFDLSPDGKKVLFVAYAAGAPGAEAKLPESAEDKLFELNVNTKAIRDLKKPAHFAIYSPDGSHVLIGGDLLDDVLTLEVAGADLTKFVPIAKDAAKSISSTGQDTDIYPGWVDNGTVYYLARRAAFGIAGVNLQLATVGADGQGRRSQQSLLDTEAAK